MEYIAPLFAQRGEVGADGAEGLGTSDGTEAPGGSLLELGHADIAFCLVVVEGHTRVGEKTQDIVGMLTQTQQKIDRGGLLDSSTLFGLGSGAQWIVPLALGEDGFVLTAQTRDLRSCQGALGPLGGIGLGLGSAQEVRRAWVLRLRLHRIGADSPYNSFASPGSASFSGSTSTPRSCQRRVPG